MLTDVACRKAAKRDKPHKLSDGGGLYLEVLASGAKSWRWKYRLHGKEKRLTFGLYPDVGLQEARERRGHAARTLRSGVDPAIARKQESARARLQSFNTFRPAAEAWIEQQRPIWSTRYAKDVERSLEEYVYPELGALALTDITAPMVLKVLKAIEARGSIETARRVRLRISEVFRQGIAAGTVAQDPAASLGSLLAKQIKGKFPAVRTMKEAKAVLAKLEDEPGWPLSKLANRLLALTAVRSAVLRMAERPEFEDLDGPEPIWRIPATKMKLTAHRKADVAFEFIVPLSRQAVAVVQLALKLSPGKLIFRNARDPLRAITDSTISKAYREAGFAGIHVPHGWRSTFSTVMNELAEIRSRDGDRAIIDLMLAHVPQGVEAVYNRAGYMTRRREIAQEWADMLTEGLMSPAELIQVKRQR